MNGNETIIPKYFEGLDVPAEYFQPLDKPCFEKRFHLNILQLTRYAEAENKRIDDLTRDEIMMFSTKPTFEETFPVLFDMIRKRDKATA